AMTHIFLLLLLLLLPCLTLLFFFPPPSLAQPNTACPLDFHVLRDLLDSSTFPTNRTSSEYCQYIRQGLWLVESQYLLQTSTFLPPLASADSCWRSYQTLVDSFFPNFDIRSACGFQTSWISQGCMDIVTKSDYEAKFPPDYLRDVTSTCANYSCALCTTKLSDAHARYLTGPYVGNVTDCSAYPFIYAAAFASRLGPLDIDTANCLFLLRLPLKKPGKKKRKGLILGLSLGSFVLLLALGGGFWWYYRYKRRQRGRSRRSRMGRAQTDLDAGLGSISESSNLVKFTYDQITEATRHFSRDNIVGKGGFGNVYKGELPDGSEVAMKRFKNCSAAGDADFAHEVEVIASVRHVNLVTLRGYCIATTPAEGHQRIIVCDLVKNGNVVEDGMPDMGPPEAMEKYVLVAVLCSHPQLYARPTMDQVVKMLETDVTIPAIPERPMPVVSKIDDLEKSMSSFGSGPISFVSKQPNTTCPLDFNVLQILLAGSRPPRNIDNAQACQYISQGLRLVQSHYLQVSNSFVPPLSSADSCWRTYQTILNPYLPKNFDIRTNCGFQTSWISEGCMNITTRSQFEAAVPNATINDVVANCNQSLANNSPCAACTTSLSRVQALHLKNGTSTRNISDCQAYPSIYAAAFANSFGPTDRGTAKCLFLLDFVAKAKGKKKSVGLILGVTFGCCVVLVAVGGGCWWFFRYEDYKRRKRRRARFERAQAELNSGLESISHSTTLIKYTFDQIKKATGNFSRDNIIGRGGYGNVYKGWLPDGSEVALKRFKNCSAAGDANFAHEVEVIASVRHVNLVALRGYCIATTSFEGHQRIIVCDLMKNGNGMPEMGTQEVMEKYVLIAVVKMMETDISIPSIPERPIPLVSRMDDIERSVSTSGSGQLSSPTGYQQYSFERLESNLTFGLKEEGSSAGYPGHVHERLGTNRTSCVKEEGSSDGYPRHSHETLKSNRTSIKEESSSAGYPRHSHERFG
ncbi:hypothetical protein Tsubulata_050410, partial [Turnera subulata]